MKVKTQPASLTASQSRFLLNGGKGVREVLVDGVVVGHYARNKHGVTIGHFDPLALVGEDNPFAAARLSHSVAPASRIHGRTTKQLVADIAAQRVGEYEAQINAARIQRAA